MLKALLFAVALTAQSQAPLKWYDVTTSPGWQAFGRLNAAGYVVDIAEWRQTGQQPTAEPVANYGVSLPSPTAGEHVRSNDREFAEAVEQFIAGQAEADCDGRRPCPRPKPKPSPPPDDLPNRYELPKLNVVPFLLAGLCVIAGLMLLCFVAFVTHYLSRPRTPNDPR